MRFLSRLSMLAVLVFCGVALAHAQPAGDEGTVERITVHSAALGGNLIGDSPARDVSVYLPPSYQAEPARRYPVVYMLHGFTDTDAQWFGVVEHWIDLPEVIDGALGEDDVREMIVVMPNGMNAFGGSMYASSATIGDWETFIAEELVAHIDATYRTLATRASRGLAGHSMGGYGTLRIGMKHAAVFSSLYALSPCCLTPGVSEDPNLRRQVEAVQTLEAVAEQPFFALATLATAAAWAPNPAKPPLYLDLPWDEHGAVLPEVATRMAANAPVVLMHQYVAALRRFSGLALDVGLGDYIVLGGTQAFHEALDAYGIAHDFHTYQGGHLDRIAERIHTHTLPFFSKHLAFE